MLRKYSIALIGTIMVAAWGFSPAAEAVTKLAPNAPTTHRTEPGQPTPGETVGRCAVSGSVSLVNGVSSRPTHDQFTFVGVTITCTGPNFGTGMGGVVPAEYGVTATGFTDGPNLTWVDTSGQMPVLRTNHGENDQAGWSWGKGDIDVNSGPEQCGQQKTSQDGGLGADNEKAATENFVEFTRVANVVTAWGHLNWTGGCTPKTDTCFKTVLEFTPTDPDTKVNTALLAGNADLWNESGANPCQGTKQTTKNDPKNP